MLTDSQLLGEDIFADLENGRGRLLKIQLRHFRVAHWHNRETAVEVRCGGVLILARDGIDFALTPQDLLPRRPFSCCSLIASAVGGR